MQFFMRIAILCAIVVTYAQAVSVSKGEALKLAQNHWKDTGRSGALDPSPWPTDHGDSARAKFTLHAGLPASIANESASALKIISVPSYAGQWLYTRGKTDVYSLSGSAPAAEFVRFDAQTLEVKQRVPAPRGMYVSRSRQTNDMDSPN